MGNLFNFQIWGDILLVFLSLLSSVIPLWLENIFGVILIFSDLFSSLMQVMVYLGEHPCVLEKNVCCALAERESVV